MPELPPVIATFLANITDFKTKLGEAQSDLSKTAAISEAKMAEITASVDKQVAEMAVAAKAAGTEFDATATKAELMATKTEEASGKSSGAFSKMAGVGKIVGLAVGAAIVGVGVEAVKSAANYQTLTTQLVTGAGESEDAIKGVSKGLLAMAPAVGVGPAALAKGMYLVESAGYHGADGLKVMQAAAEGAKIGGADMTVVSDGLTTAMNNYFPKASDAAMVTSKLVATVGAGKTTMQDLSGALAGVLPFAKGVGVGFNDVMGAMATMTGEGIHAADASTYLKFTMMSLANETPKGAQALKEVGLSAAQVNTDLKSKGISGTLAEITDAVGKKFPVGSAAYVGAISAIVGGTRGMAATLALTGDHAQTFTDNIKTIAGASTEAGNHVKGWSETTKDLSFKIEQAKAWVESASITIGTALIPVIMKAIGWFQVAVGWVQAHRQGFERLGNIIKGVVVDAFKVLVGALSKVVDVTVTIIKWIDKHKTLVGALAVVVGAMVVTWGLWTAAVAAWTVVTNIGAAAQAAFNLVMDANPIMLVVLAIAGLAAGLVYAYTHSKTFRDIVNDIGGALKKVWTDVLLPVVSFFENHWKPILIAAGLVLAPFIAIPILIAKNWGTIVSFFSGLWADVEGVFTTALGWLYDWFIGLPIKAVEWLSSFATKMLGVGNDAISGLLRGAQSAWSTLMGWVQGLETDVTNAFSTVWDGIAGTAKSAFNGVADIWNSTVGSLSFSIPSWVPGVGGDGFSMPKIPHMAAGGIVNKATLALIGEAGPEAVIPLSKMGIGQAPTPAGSGMGGAAQITINITQPLASSEDIFNAVQSAFLQHGSVNSQSYQPYVRR
jgi:TP901 family phage tail tape measure protein